MFIPSEYSGASTFALDNDSCEKYKKYRKKYLKKMWETPVFTQERQAYEHKANSAHTNYLACKEKGSSKSLGKMVKKTVGKKSTATKTTGSISPSAEADAAAAAVAAEEADGGNLPVVAFGLVALLVVGGGAYFMFGGKKKKKKKKKHHGLPGEAEKHLPQELAPARV